MEYGKLMKSQVDLIRSRASEARDAGDYHVVADALAELIALQPTQASHYINLAKAYWFQNNLARTNAVLALGYKKLTNTKNEFIKEAISLLSQNREGAQYIFPWLDSLIVNSTRDTQRRLIEKCLLAENYLDKNAVANYLDAHPDRNDTVTLCLVEFYDSEDRLDEAKRFLNEIIASNRRSTHLSIIRLTQNFRPKDLKTQLEIIEDGLSAVTESEPEHRYSLTQAKVTNLHKATYNTEAVEVLAEVNKSAHATPESLRQEYFFRHYEEESEPTHLRAIVQKWSALSKYTKNTKSHVGPNKNGHERKQDSALRLGFISKNFRAHPIGWMTAGFFCELHHTFGNDAEAVIFSTAHYDDFIAKTIRAVTKDNFHAVGHLTDDELISFMNKQGIDYLIDLDGMISGHRLHAVLNQKAPVVKWVGGLIGSTYLEGIDYLVTDRAQTPEEFQSDFTEKLLILDDSYVTYTPPPYKLEVTAAPCLNKQQITFGCFNNGVKLSSKTIEVWAKILLNDKSSTLLLKDRAFDQKLARDRIIQLFKLSGVDSSRIHFLGSSSHKDHLLAHHQVDICLDPLPYSGGLSTLEAAYMGVPVVSRPGRLLAHRHSASHLKSLDCQELIATTDAAYIKLANDLAQNYSRINEYRQNLRKNLYKGPLLDHEKFTKEFIKKLANL